MYYLGSKAKHADQILKHVLATRKNEQPYIEPFVGGGNVLCRVPQSKGRRIAGDVNQYMIALLDALGNHDWQPPPTMPESLYYSIRNKPEDYEPALVAMAAIGASFGSMWFGGYVKDERGISNSRWKASTKAALRDAPGLKGAEFHCCSYDALLLPTEPCLIYCDPPYRDTTQYEGAITTIKVGESGGKNDWKAVVFWRWCDEMVDCGHTVFVSEYTSPLAEAYNVPASSEYREAKAEAARLQTEIRNKDGTSQQDGVFDYFAEPAEDKSELRDKLNQINESLVEQEHSLQSQRQRLADRWRVVWEKDVKVNINAVSEIDTKIKQKTEKLFMRMPE